MALVLDATVGGSASNSYLTRPEADAYHDSHLYASTWNALTTTRKEMALVMATRVLDDEVEWFGSKASTGQALRWPRYGVAGRDSGGEVYDTFYGYSIDSTIIPQWLKNATAELARCLVEQDRTADAGLLEFSHVEIGPLSLTKDQSKAQDVLPESVKAMVKWYGYMQSRSGISMARLVRA